MRSHPKLVPNLMHNLTPQFCPLHRCYYYWGKGSKSPYSKHQLAASEDVVQEGEISGYLKEKKKPKNPAFQQLSSLSSLFRLHRSLETQERQKGWGGLRRPKVSQGLKETSQQHTHFAGLNHDDPRILIILFLLLLFGVNAL